MCHPVVPMKAGIKTLAIGLVFCLRLRSMTSGQQKTLLKNSLNE